MPLPDPGEMNLLVERLRAGDREAFEMLVRSFVPPLYAYLNRFVGDAHVAEDLFQEVFLKVHTDLARYAEGTSFSAWLYTLAHNLAIDWLRRRREEPVARRLLEDQSTRSTMESPTCPAGTLPEGPVHGVDPARLATAVLGLPVAQRAVVCLRAYGELSFKDIARVLGEPLGTVLGRMRLATITLRKELAPRAEVKS
jgi:RNA polymerase sigma-70 factor (ECF subfamily)